MYKQVMRILNEQEQEESAIYQSADLVRAMIKQDFKNSADVLRLMKDGNSEVLRFWKAPSFAVAVRKRIVPVRTSDSFGIHKHTCCQVPYFHDHDFYELIYVLRGTCYQEFDHSSNPLLLQENQSCLLCPGTIHSVGTCGGNDIILKFTIPGPMFFETVAPVLPEHKKEKVVVFEHGSSQVPFYIFMLLKEVYCRQRFSEAAIRNYLSLLFIEFGRETSAQTSEIMHQLLVYFQHHAADASLHGFAAQIGYSDAHSGRMIKESTGRSFLELAVEWKVKRAAELLEKTDDSVEDIAYALGYSNPSGLYKQFCSAYGMTPNAYRKMTGR